MTGTDAPFDVVFIGSGLGIYALTRAFHERYGIVSTVVAIAAPEPFARSITCTVKDVPAGADDAAWLSALTEVAGQRPAGRKALLLCNTDGDIEFIARNREVLDQHYEIRIPTLESVQELSDKAEFARLCRELEIDTPRTEVLDFRDGSLPAVDGLDLPYPVVAKPAVSTPHVNIRMAGKKKVYFISSADELADLASRLHGAGFRDRFVVQELIPGDDTTMRSVTAYRDSHGEVTLLASAAVLLEEHTPDALGRPAAMISTTFPDTLEQARRILDATDYVGFANFDVKEDPRTGKQHFFEVNPRIGRNSYYVTGAGANVAEFVADDAIYGRRREPVVGIDEVLYTIVPKTLLMRYVLDPEKRKWVKRVARKRTVNPWLYRKEGAWMQFHGLAKAANHVRKFLKHYPKPTETGF
ncbi:carboxylate--amine ligase [Dermabacteraceae bacterium P13115]